MIHKLKCFHCGKLHRNKKFCSWKCYTSSSFAFKQRSKGGKIGGRIGAEKSHIINKKNKKSFWDSKLQSKLGKRGGHNAQKTLKKLKKGLYNPETSKKGGKATHKKHPNLASEMGKLNWKKANETNKRNKTAVYDPEIQRKGELASRSTVIVENMTFTPIPEAEIGLCIHYQIEKIKLWKNYQFVVGRKRIDFFVLDTFIEVHPDTRDDPEEYFNKRRKILNQNGYAEYPFIVI